jgi:hypothetical protein
MWIDYPPVHHAIEQWLWRYWPFITTPIVLTIAVFWKKPEIDGNFFIPILIAAFFASMTVAEWIYPTPKPAPNPMPIDCQYPNCPRVSP